MEIHVAALVEFLDQHAREAGFTGTDVTEDYRKTAFQMQLDEDVGEGHVVFFGEIKNSGSGLVEKGSLVNPSNL